MKEVTKKEFYKIIYDNKLDVRPVPMGNYPYTTIWKLKDGRIWGKTEPTDIDYKKFPKYPFYEEHYYIVETC
ncbi:hypothetical protein [Alistipes putredinis]|uniref:hypothetical protein n=1 Tax=Bacteroidales TaxID=171549 RepID=UPI003AB075B5